MIHHTIDKSNQKPVAITLSGDALKAFEAVRDAMVAENSETRPTDRAVIAAALQSAGTSLVIGDGGHRLLPTTTNDKR